MTVRAGTVYLVGAGPGDPRLITVHGLEVLRAADVVLYDRLVSQTLLDEARTGADLVDVGKVPYTSAVAQEHISATLVRLARDGRIVVRLKGGDPFLFGRGYEEWQACADAGVPCEVVPGVTSAFAAPLAAGIPVTLRGVASTVAVCAAPALRDEHWPALAAMDTVVFLMGVRELPQLSEKLMAAGRDARTPAAVIANATCPGERVVRGPLHDVAAAAAREGIGAPAVFVVGPTAAASETSGALAGRRIVVTRPRDAAHELVRGLRAVGADVVPLPLIRIQLAEPPASRVVGELDDYDWIVFTSRHGVRGFRALLWRLGADARRLRRTRIAAVGPTTARAAEEWGLRVDLVARPARAEALVAALRAQEPRPRRVLFPCGTLARDVVPTALAEDGIDVEPLIVYDTLPIEPGPDAAAAFDASPDAVLLASPSAVAALARLAPRLADTAVVCIGPTTAAAAREHGWPRVYQSAAHSDQGMIATTCEVLTARSA